jgi:hypothetical protein
MLRGIIFDLFYFYPNKFGLVSSFGLCSVSIRLNKPIQLKAEATACFYSILKLLLTSFSLFFIYAAEQFMFS